MGLLPLPAAVDEFCLYAQQERSTPPQFFDMRAFEARLGLLLKMLSSVTPVESELEKRLLDHLVGDDAISTDTRSLVWDIFAQTAHSTGMSENTQFFLDRCLTQFVPTLSADLVTTNLVSYLAHSIANQVLALYGRNGPEVPLEIPLLDQLHRIALETPHPRVAADATQLMNNLAFQKPIEHNFPPLLVADAQIALVRRCMENLRTDYEKITSASNAFAERRFARGLQVMKGLLDCSRKCLGFYQSPVPATTIIIGDRTSGKPRVTLTIQLHAGNPQPSTHTVDASEDATVRDLMSAVSDLTDCQEFTVIAGGQLLKLDAMSDLTLSMFNVKTTGVLLIRLKHNLDCDPNRILTHLGPIEQEIVSHFERFCSFLDGPSAVAKQVRLTCRQCFLFRSC